jgi:hypothetical protein
MSNRTATILVVGILLGGLLVACSTKRDPDLLPASHAQPAEAGGQVPPGIRKDVKVAAVTIPAPGLGLPPRTGAEGLYEEWSVVKEVKGNWVLLGFTPTETAAEADFKYVEVWINFNTVIGYRTK